MCERERGGGRSDIEREIVCVHECACEFSFSLSRLVEVLGFFFFANIHRESHNALTRLTYQNKHQRDISTRERRGGGG